MTEVWIFSPVLCWSAISFPLGLFALVHLKQTPFRQSSASELGIDETAGIPESPWRTDCVASVVYGRPVRWSAGQTHVSDTEPSLTDPLRPFDSPDSGRLKSN